MDENNELKQQTTTKEKPKIQKNEILTNIWGGQKDESEDLVKNPFSMDFLKNVESQKEFEKQHAVYSRQEQIKVTTDKVKITEKSKSTEKTYTKVKTTIQTPNYDMIQVPDSGLKFDEKKKIKKKFRLKLVACVYCIVFALCAGWVVYNSIEINNSNYQIVQYLIKIDQLDTANQIESGDGNVISTVIPIETQKLAEPTEVAQQTNWFDKLCNFLTNLFGGK